MAQVSGLAGNLWIPSKCAPQMVRAVLSISQAHTNQDGGTGAKILSPSSPRRKALTRGEIHITGDTFAGGTIQQPCAANGCP